MVKFDVNKNPLKESESILLGQNWVNQRYLLSLFLAIAFLLGLGLVQIYSASFIFAIESFDDGLFFVKKQALFVICGFAVLIFSMYVPWRWVERIAVSLWFLAVAGIALTYIPGLGVKVGGASRWLNLGGGYRFEPSEILKYTYPFVWASLLTLSPPGEKPYKKILNWGIAMAPLILLLKQPDFGSFAILAVAFFAVLFAMGLRWKYVFVSLSSLAGAFYFLIMRVPYRRARLSAFLDPWSDPEQKGFQIIQSMLGFHSGGLTGVGLGEGQGKLFFLPEAHTDFTLSVLGEELGFIGILVVLMIFGFIVLRGLQISVKTKGQKEQIIALGITVIFAITALINVGVTMGVLPTKGLGIPFLSYGGSALIATCFGLGVLLNIDKNIQSQRARNFIKIQK